MRNAATDLTEGTPWKIIMRFSIPLFFTFLLQQFYNMVDTIVVGQFLGKDALAGVGSTGAINFMIIGFCMGLANGFVIPVAQRYGAKDYKDMRRFVANSIWLTVFFAAIMSITVCILCRSVLIAMKIYFDKEAAKLAQAFSVVLSLWCIKTKFPILKMEPGEWKLHGKHIGILCKMGIPMGLQYSITAIGSVVLQTGINTLGSAAVASVSAASKLSMFLACPFDAIGSAMATYTGQNVGAGKIERIGQGLKASVLIGITYSILIFLVMLFSAKYWMLLFINASETEIIHNAVLFILANSGFYIALVFVNAVRFTIQGAGFSGLAILAGVMEMIARAIIGVIMVPYLGFASVCFASPLAWIMADCFLIPAYCHVIRKLKQRRAQGVPNM